jgi:hypothetical protein
MPLDINFYFWIPGAPSTIYYVIRFENIKIAQVDIYIILLLGLKKSFCFEKKYCINKIIYYYYYYY